MATEIISWSISTKVWGRGRTCNPWLCLLMEIHVWYIWSSTSGPDNYILFYVPTWTFLAPLWKSGGYIKISFPLNILKTIDRISPNFVYASNLELLRGIFPTIVPELWPLVYHRNFVSAQYLETKLTEFHQILYAFILTRSTLGSLHIIFRTFAPELSSLIYAKILFPLNIFR